MKPIAHTARDWLRDRLSELIEALRLLHSRI